MLNSWTRFLGTLCLSLLLSSCGIDFQAKWASAVKQPSDGLSGRWAGTWKSDVNGHNGTLKCVIGSADASGKRDFTYRATWLHFLSATFKTQKTVKPSGQGYVFDGSKNLGMMGGEFRCKGSATKDHFHSTYESALDHGKFEMKRAQ